MSMLQFIRHRPRCMQQRLYLCECDQQKESLRAVSSQPLLSGASSPLWKQDAIFCIQLGRCSSPLCQQRLRCCKVQTKTRTSYVRVRTQQRVTLTSPCDPNVLFRRTRTHEFRVTFCVSAGICACSSNSCRGKGLSLVRSYTNI